MLFGAIRCCAGFDAVQVLATAIAASKFSAAEALHRMTDGMANREGPRNGPLRPTLATKWGFSVQQPASAINAHVGALRQFLVRTLYATLARFVFFRGGFMSQSYCRRLVRGLCALDAAWVACDHVRFLAPWRFSLSFKGRTRGGGG